MKPLAIFCEPLDSKLADAAIQEWIRIFERYGREKHILVQVTLAILSGELERLESGAGANTFCHSGASLYGGTKN